MSILLQANSTGAYINATFDVLFFIAIATLLATLFWYFAWHKKDRSEIEKRDKQLEKIQPKYEILSNQHEHLKAEHYKLKQGLSELVDNYQALENQHKAFVQTQNSAKNFYEQADEERQGLLDSYESIENNYNVLDQKYNDAVTAMDRLEEEIESLKENNLALKAFQNHLLNEIEKMEAILEEAGHDLDDIRSEYEQETAEDDDEIERLLGGIQGQIMIPTVANATNEGILKDREVQSLYDALKEDYNQIRNEHTKLNNQFQALQETHQKMLALREQADQATNNEQFQSLQKDYQALQTIYTTLKEEHDQQLLPKLRATQQLLSQKEESNRQLLSKLEAQSATYQLTANQTKNFEDLKATNQALYLNNKTLNEKNDQLQKQYDELSQEYTGLKSQFQLLRTQFKQIEDQLDQLSTASEKEGAINYQQLKIDYENALLTQEKQTERIAELEELLLAIDESSSYGIIYLPSNLQIIEGIDQKIERVLNKANISTWKNLAFSTSTDLAQIIKDAGNRYKNYNPERWSQQAQLLIKGDWKGFRELEAELINGRKLKENQKTFDDLKVIEGIGPKIEVLLNSHKILTWKKLSITGIGELKRILKTGGSKYQRHDPSTWPEQAAFAAASDWEKLEAFKKRLKRGRQER